MESPVPTGPKAPPGKWLLIHGIHKGTITSRDFGRTEHDSEDAAQAAYITAKAAYAEIGYVTWFAKLYDDQGNMTKIDEGEYV